jgi:hypothetical protein
MPSDKPAIALPGPPHDRGSTTGAPPTAAAAPSTGATPSPSSSPYRPNTCDGSRHCPPPCTKLLPARRCRRLPILISTISSSSSRRADTDGIDRPAVLCPPPTNARLLTATQPTPRILTPARRRTRATSSRNPGRDHLGWPRRLRRNPQPYHAGTQQRSIVGSCGRRQGFASPPLTAPTGRVPAHPTHSDFKRGLDLDPNRLATKFNL